MRGRVCPRTGLCAKVSATRFKKHRGAQLMSGLRIGIAVLLGSAFLFPIAGCGKKEESTAKPSAPARARDTSVAGVVAELVESKRKEGVLTVQIRFRNTTAKAVT